MDGGSKGADDMSCKCGHGPSIHKYDGTGICLLTECTCIQYIDNPILGVVQQVDCGCGHGRDWHNHSPTLPSYCLASSCSCLVYKQGVVTMNIGGGGGSVTFSDGSTKNPINNIRDARTIADKDSKNVSNPARVQPIWMKQGTKAREQLIIDTADQLDVIYKEKTSAKNNPYLYIHITIRQTPRVGLSVYAGYTGGYRCSWYGGDNHRTADIAGFKELEELIDLLKEATHGRKASANK